jgi:hypothetical protein
LVPLNPRDKRFENGANGVGFNPFKWESIQFLDERANPCENLLSVWDDARSLRRELEKGSKARLQTTRLREGIAHGL